MLKAWLSDPARPSLGAPLPPGSVRPPPIPRGSFVAGGGRAVDAKGTGSGPGSGGEPQGHRERAGVGRGTSKAPVAGGGGRGNPRAPGCWPMCWL